MLVVSPNALLVRVNLAGGDRARAGALVTSNASKTYMHRGRLEDHYAEPRLPKNKSQRKAGGARAEAVRRLGKAHTCSFRLPGHVEGRNYRSYRVLH